VKLGKTSHDAGQLWVKGIPE